MPDCSLINQDNNAQTAVIASSFFWRGRVKLPPLGRAGVGILCFFTFFLSPCSRRMFTFAADFEEVGVKHR